MLFKAIQYLKATETPPAPPPSERWLQYWLKNTKDLHVVRSKPIARQRVELHTEDDIETWFGKYEDALQRRGITEPRDIYNMDESGARIGVVKWEEIVLPIEQKEIHTASPENRKSITIIEAISADGNQSIPPAIICPGQRFMESWLHDNLQGDELLMLSPTGYTNESLALDWLQHFIKYSGPGPDKPWKILLLDGQRSHESPDFVLNCLANKIEVKPPDFNLN